MKTGLVIPIYNRPAYVKQCFDSLLKLTVKPYMLVLVNDHSADAEIQPLIKSIKQFYGNRCYVFNNNKNEGVRYSLRLGIDACFGKCCDIVINLDSDAIVKPDFVERLTGQYMKCAANFIVSGFNCDTPTNPVIDTYTGNWVKRRFCNGINMCFNKAQYEKYIKPSLAQVGNWDYNTSLRCQADNLPFIVTTPSVVQHIGYESSMGHKGGDFAQDFKMLSLPDVTLFGIDSHDKAGIERAASISQRSIEFGAVNIITDDLFTRNGSSEVRRTDYSRFMIKELNKQFKTSHVLTIHADGYVVNWQAWDNSWLQYDYIGATWLYKDGMNVGNGGFSLRSKRLCQILADGDIEPQYMHPEDHCICRTYRQSLEDAGIKFAPEEVANKFSIEAYGASAIVGANMYGGQFGFHSPHVDFSRSDIPEDMRLLAKPVVVSSQRRMPQPTHRR